MINLMTEEEEKLEPKKQILIFKIIRFITSHIIILPIFLSSLLLIINLNFFAFSITILAAIYYLISHITLLMQNVVEYSSKRYWLMIILSIFLFPFFLITLLITVQSGKETWNHYVVPYPGKMIDVGTHKMHMHCQGTGSPAVLFVHGFVGFSLDWSLMQPIIATFTKACTFDRSGYGWSEFGPLPRDGKQFSKEVNAMLKAENISNSDIVIVAHSRKFIFIFFNNIVGGALTRAYYPTNKDNIKGIMMIDALDVNEPLIPPFEEGEQNPVPFYAYLLGISSGLGFNFISRSTIDHHDISDENVNLYHQKNYERSDFIKSTILEFEDFPSLFAQANQTENFGNVPLVVYGAGNGKIYFPKY